MIIAVGALDQYIWNIWQNRHNKKKLEDTMHTKIFPYSDDPFPLGQMRASKGKKEISLTAIKIEGEVHGLLFSSKTTQIYENRTDSVLEIIYTFPMAWGTALLGLCATIGTKRLTGQVITKNKAEQQYEKAISDGDSAIMVEESSTGLYTANLGNIKPGETVTVTIISARLLHFEQGRIRLCIPTVIGKRYGDPHADGGLAPHESVETDASVQYGFAIRITIFGAMAKNTISCPSHTVHRTDFEDSLILETKDKAFLDRDFVLLITDIQETSIAQQVSFGNETMIVASFCPKIEQAKTTPLALKILVDCSGSMQGERIEQAKKGLQKSISLLTQNDFVSYTEFGSNVRHKNNGLQPCTENCLSSLSKTISKTNANMGGTNMESALLATFSIPTIDNIPSVVFIITDGDVWAMDAVIKAAKNSGHRIFVIGVGQAPSESLLRELAKQTGGACDFVLPNENMADAVVRMFHRMRNKTAEHIQVQWNCKTVWQSRTPRFIYDGETVHCFAHVENEGIPKLQWEVDGKTFCAQAEKLEKVCSEELFRLGMFKKIEESESSSEIEALGMQYQLVTKYTSLILTYMRDEKIQGSLPKIQHVPHMPAAGHGCTMPIIGAFLAPSFAQTSCFGGQSIFSRAFAQSAPEENTVCDDYPTLIKKMLEYWQKEIYTQRNIVDTLSFLKKDSQFEPLAQILKKLQNDSSISRESVYAVFMLTILENYAPNLLNNRHATRLINAYLPKNDNDCIRKMKEQCKTLLLSQKTSTI